MLEESQVVFHVDLEDEEILPSAQRWPEGWTQGLEWQKPARSGHSGRGDGMLLRLGPASAPCG